MFGVFKERDPQLLQLQNKVFADLIKAASEEDFRVGYQEIQTKNSRSLPDALSVEDAVKELLQIKSKL